MSDRLFEPEDGRKPWQRSDLERIPAHRRFDGETYEPPLDAERLTTLMERVAAVMRDGDWHTLRELAVRTGGTEASVSARLRDLRKPRFGGGTVERRRVEGGLFTYRLVLEA